MSQIKAQFSVNRGDFQLDINIKLPTIGISALFGPSGSGKTTCLRAMAGLEKLPNSRFAIGETIWQDDAQDIFVPTHQRAIGYVFQEASLFPHLSVQQNLNFGQKRIPSELRQIKQGDVVELLGIEHLLARDPTALSGGERQRVAIARALLTSPKLLLMDEPLSALDLARKREILPYLENLHQELSIPVVYVSHSAEEVARLADHITLLQQGKVIASGPIANVMLHQDSAQLFTDGVSTLWQGKVSGQKEGLTEVTVGQQTLILTQREQTIGQAIRCRIFASDVSLSLSHPIDSSIINSFESRVNQIETATHAGEVIVTLELAPNHLLQAQISSYSLKRLNIQINQTVWAQVKSVAVL